MSWKAITMPYAMRKMTENKLKLKFDALQYAGLSEVIRARAENAVLYRKWGNLGEWGPARASIQRQLRNYQPEYLAEIVRIFNEA